MKVFLVLSILLLNTFLVQSGPIQDGVYYIINRAYLQVLQVPDWSYNDGAPVNFDSITGGDNQKFQLTSVGDFYKITALHSGRALTVPSFMSAGNAEITQWIDNGENLQHWNIFAPEYYGFYKIQSRYSGKLLTCQQEYIYWPVGWADPVDSGPIEEPVAAAPDVADAAVGQSDGAPIQADLSVAWPTGYSVKNKLIHSTISPGNYYQDFLFVKVAGYDTINEPVPVAMEGPVIESSVADEVFVDMGDAAGASGPAAPVMDTIQPIEVPVEQAEPDVAEEPVSSAFDVDFANTGLDEPVAQPEVASSVQETAQTESRGFLAVDAPVVEEPVEELVEPVEPAVQEEILVAADAAGQGQN